MRGYLAAVFAQNAKLLNDGKCVSYGKGIFTYEYRDAAIEDARGVKSPKIWNFGN